MKNLLILFTLVFGVAVSYTGDQILIKYKRGKQVRTSYVSKDLSVCMPKIGQAVYFYKKYKVVTCVEDDNAL